MRRTACKDNVVERMEHVQYARSRKSSFDGMVDRLDFCDKLQIIVVMATTMTVGVKR
jgi:hypothetical protein